MECVADCGEKVRPTELIEEAGRARPDIYLRYYAKAMTLAIGIWYIQNGVKIRLCDGGDGRCDEDMPLYRQPSVRPRPTRGTHGTSPQSRGFLGQHEKTRVPLKTSEPEQLPEGYLLWATRCLHRTLERTAHCSNVFACRPTNSMCVSYP